MKNRMRIIACLCAAALLITSMLAAVGCGGQSATFVFSGCAKPADEPADVVTETDAAEPGDIFILFTNDVHCGVDDDIGYAGLAAYKRQLSEKSPYVTLVDCGDHIQGSYMGLASKGMCIVDIMNEVGYDYAVFGNHEFDYGTAALAELVDRADAQYLCCNVTYNGSGENALAGAKPYEIAEYGDTSVAFIGVSTPNTLSSSTPSHFIENDKFVYDFSGGNDGKDLYAVIQKNIDECRAEGADYVILLTHCGADEADAPYTSLEIIANTSGVDAVLDAHSHTEIPSRFVVNKDGYMTILSQSGTKLNNIGQLVITQSGIITAGMIEDYPQKDGAVTAKIEEYRDTYEKELDKVVAHLDFDLLCSDAEGVRMVRSRELPIGDMTADAYRVIGNADIGMCNGGGIRADIKAGDVTLHDIIDVNPFGNSLCVVEVTGAELRDMVEYFYRSTQRDYVKDGAAYGEDGSFMQISGMKLTVDTSVESTVEVADADYLSAVGDKRRVSDIMVLEDGEYVPLDDEKTYTVASSNYIIKQGGCGTGIILADNELVINESIADYQILIDYIDSIGGDFSAYETVDDRITIK